MTGSLDAPRLYQDLLDHFGTGSRVYGMMNVALGQIDTYYQSENWEGLLQLASNAGFDLMDYITLNDED